MCTQLNAPGQELEEKWSELRQKKLGDIAKAQELSMLAKEKTGAKITRIHELWAKNALVCPPDGLQPSAWNCTGRGGGRHLCFITV